jgi:hypothetical protein
MTTPYYLSDLYQRTAYSEWTAMNLLAPSLYFTLRTLVSRRRRVLNIVLTAVFWTGVGLSHNITYLYGVLFGAIFIVSFAISRRMVGRLVRLAFAGALHAALILWYVAPQLVVLNDLMMKERTTVSDRPFSTVACFLDLGVMLAGRPVKLPGNPEAPELGLQVGWAILAGIGLALIGLAIPRGRRSWTKVVLLFSLFAIAFLLAWSPVDFWRYFVGPFRYVQFSYRLLLFTALFGAVLGGVGLSFWLPRFTGRRAGRWGGALGMLGMFALLVGVGYLTRPYVPPDTRIPDGDLDRLIHTPEDFAGLEDYQISNALAAKTSWFHRDLNLAGFQYNLLYGDLQERHGVPLPAPPAASGLLVEGVALEPGKVLSEAEFAAAVLKIEVDGRGSQAVAFKDLPSARTFSVVVPIDKNVPLTNPTKVSVWLEYGKPPDMARALRLTKVQWQDPAAGAMDDRELRAAESIKPNIRRGGRLSYRFASDRPVLLQMPVLYYPHELLDVRDSGKRVKQYGNIGRFVALDLKPGGHNISVVFAGLDWANQVSAVAWGFVVVVGGLALWTRKRQLKAGLPKRRRVGTAVGVLGVGALVVGLGGEQIYAFAKSRLLRLDRPIDVSPIASSEARSDQSAGNLVDGNTTTVWAARGGGPATLTLIPHRAARLRSIELEARGEALYEAWQRVHAVLWRSGGKVLEKDFVFDNADKVRTQTILFDGFITDRIELQFSDPVLRTVAGQPIPAEAVNPGYREIRLHWDGRRDATPD